METADEGAGAPRRRRSPRPRRLAYRGRCEGSCVHRSPPAEHGIGRPRCSTDGQPRSHDRHGARRHADCVATRARVPTPKLGLVQLAGMPGIPQLPRLSPARQHAAAVASPGVAASAEGQGAAATSAAANGETSGEADCCQRIHQRPRRRWWRSQDSRRRMMPRARSWLAQNRFLVRDSLWSRSRRVRPRSWHAWWCSTGC